MFGYIAFLGSAQLTVAIHGGVVMIPTDTVVIEDGIWLLYEVAGDFDPVGSFAVVDGKPQAAVITDEGENIVLCELDENAADELASMLEKIAQT